MAQKVYKIAQDQEAKDQSIKQNESVEELKKKLEAEQANTKIKFEVERAELQEYKEELAKIKYDVERTTDLQKITGLAKYAPEVKLKISFHIQNVPQFCLCTITVIHFPRLLLQRSAAPGAALRHQAPCAQLPSRSRPCSSVSASHRIASSLSLEGSTFHTSVSPARKPPCQWCRARVPPPAPPRVR